MYICSDELKCPKENCHAWFDTKPQLLGHLKIAHRRWACTNAECKKKKKTFSRENDLNNHIRDHHSDEPPERLACKLCGKTLQNKKSLKQHEDRCGGKKKRECKDCGAHLANSTDVRNHEMMHEKEVLREQAREASRRAEEEKARKLAAKGKGADGGDNDDDNGDD